MQWDQKRKVSKIQVSMMHNYSIITKISTSAQRKTHGAIPVTFHQCHTKAIPYPQPRRAKSSSPAPVNKRAEGRWWILSCQHVDCCSYEHILGENLRVCCFAICCYNHLAANRQGFPPFGTQRVKHGRKVNSTGQSRTLYLGFAIVLL